jgi:subtilisin family serine protease
MKTKVFNLMTAILLSVSVLMLPGAGTAQSLENLARHPKLIEPELVMENFQAGKTTSRVIINLAEPPSAKMNKNFSSQNYRATLMNEVNILQENVIKDLDTQHIKVTNRFIFVPGFAAEVTPEGLEQILRHPGVISVNNDHILHAQLAQGIPQISADTVRSTYDGSGISIAICDTGIDYTHPRLGGGGFPNAKVIGGYDTGDNDPDPMDTNGHGTSCAGIAAGDLGTVGDYIGGVAPGARLYAVKIATGSSGSASSAAMIDGWEWCVLHQNDDPANPIMAISTSFGGGYYGSLCDGASPAMTTAAANAVAAGITLFVSSGNDGYCDGTGWPACISHVNSVGAVFDGSLGYKGYCISTSSCIGYYYGSCTSTWACDHPSTSADQVTCYSNSADFLTIFAPSNDAYTTDITGSGGYSSGDYYSSFGGTSAACPYTAGAAACLQNAAMILQGSYLSPGDVQSHLTSTGDPITDPKAYLTRPRVNLQAAVDSLGAPGNSFRIYNDGTTDLDITAMIKRDGDPWLSWNPNAPFTVSPGGYRSVTVNIDWNQVPPGGDDERIWVESNDADMTPYPTGVYINATPACSDPPVINSVTHDGCISELCQAAISATAHDPCGGSLSYSWTPLNGGVISGSGASVSFDPPDSGPHPCPYTVRLTVTSDATGLSASQDIDIAVKLAGDADGNGTVNVFDLRLIRNHFGETPASPGWDPRSDVNCDGVVNVFDLRYVRNQFGSSGCPCP